MSHSLTDPSRLQALQISELMDRPTDPALARAVRTATRVLGVPVGLLSLVDESRQYFAAHSGLSAELSAERQTPLSHSFCQHVVVSGEPLIVTDARSDARVQDNPAIDDHGVVAYLGVPVRDPTGYVLGSFCAIENDARQWSAEDLAALQDIAAGVESEIALREQLRRVKAAEERETAERSRLSLIADTAPVMIAQFDRDHCHRFVNHQYARFFGETIEDVLDRPIEDFVGGIWNEARRIAEAALAGQGGEAEFQVPAKDSQEDVTLRVMVAPEHDRGERAIIGYVLAIVDVSQTRHVEQELRINEERLRLALQAGQMGTYDYDPVSGKAKWDEALYRIWCIDPEIDNPMDHARQRVHPEDHIIYDERYASLLDPESAQPGMFELRIVDPETGWAKWIHATAFVQFERGQATRIVGTVQDISSRKEQELQRSLLTRELNHRVKNLFSVVAGMVSMTARNSSDTVQMADSLRGRLFALSRAHEMIRPVLTKERVGHAIVSLEDLTRALLEPHEAQADQIELSGPLISLNTHGATNLALVIHEFATNAVKHGSLSTPAGGLSIGWRRSGDRLILTWEEEDGPSIESEPQTKGFGSVLVDLSVRQQLNGKINTSWHDHGMRTELDLPLSRVVE